jgi:hypothetical protein
MERVLQSRERCAPILRSEVDLIPELCVVGSHLAPMVANFENASTLKLFGKNNEHL